jgi:hypothetical protein
LFGAMFYSGDYLPQRIDGLDAGDTKVAKE